MVPHVRGSSSDEPPRPDSQLSIDGTHRVPKGAARGSAYGTPVLCRVSAPVRRVTLGPRYSLPGNPPRGGEPARGTSRGITRPRTKLDNWEFRKLRKLTCKRLS